MDRAFANLKTFWDEYLAQFSCETPDPAFNSMVNIHNPRQCQPTQIMCKYRKPIRATFFVLALLLGSSQLHAAFVISFDPTQTSTAADGSGSSEPLNDDPFDETPSKPGDP